jgi:hypothetical protein
MEKILKTIFKAIGLHLLLNNWVWAQLRTEPVAPPLLQLTPIAGSPEHCGINSCGAQRCRWHFTDVIYESRQNRFRLLRDHAPNILIDSADELKKNLLSTDPDSRINALNDAGLLEPLLEPKASSFLDAPQSQRYLEIELELTAIRSEIEQTRAQAKPHNGLDIDTPDVTWEDSLLIGERQRDYHTLKRELAALDTQGRKIARERGYFFENGHLYSAEAMKARTIIQRYLRQRKAFVNLGQQHFTPEELAKFEEEYTQIIADIRVANTQRIAPRRDVELWLAQSKGKLVYAELTKTLLEAATYGVALSECALKGDSERIPEGFKTYEQYRQ